MEGNKSTRAYVKKNPGVNLQGKLPPRRRNDLHKKRNVVQGGNYHEQVTASKNTQCDMSEHEFSYRGSKSNSELFDDSFFDAPEILYQWKDAQRENLNLGPREINELLYAS